MTQQHTLADAARIRAPGDAAATSSDAVDAIFADLLCADSDLLRLEFDAITADLSPTGTGQRHRCPPARRPQVATSRRRPPVDPVGPGPTTAGPPRVRPTALEPRERSPPARVGTLRPTSGGDRFTLALSYEQRAVSGGGPMFGAITITTLAQHHRARRPLVQQR